MDLTTIPKTFEAWREAWDQMRPFSAAGPHAMELAEIDEERIVIRMPITDAARQPFGLFHGGISLLLAESAASFHSCWGLDLAKFAPVGLEINGSHLASAREGWVRADARVVKRGRRVVVHEVDIVHEESGKQLCRARVTNLIVESR